MKLRLSKGNSNEQGGTLLVVLFTGLIMGVSLASILQYTATQARSIKRSQSWNNAIPVAEAGVEEALAHINDSTIGTNFAINGWSRVGNEFRKEGSVDSQTYQARISTNKWPIITVTGNTKDGRTTNVYKRTIQVTTTQASTGMKGILSKGNVVMDGTTVVDSFDSEDERYSTSGHYDPAKRKDGGYVASVYGDVVGTTVYGTVGTGPTGTATGNVGSFAWLGSNTGIQPGAYANDVNYSFPVAQPPYNGNPPPNAGPISLSLTNFKFWSTMVTSTNPPAFTPPSGIVTNETGTYTVLWPAYPVGVWPGNITTNWTTVVQAKTLPLVGVYRNAVKHTGKWDYELLTSYSYVTKTYSYSLTATNSSVTSDSYAYVISDANTTGLPVREQTELNELRMSGGEKLLCLATNGILYIRGDFTMVGNSEIIIAPGASLKIYVGGEVNLAGNGIFNYTQDSSKVEMFGLETCKKIAISGNASYTGVIYAPQADLEMNGGGSDIYDVIGAVTVNSAELNGHFQFHYDERLGRAKILAKYQVASWKEL